MIPLDLCEPVPEIELHRTLKCILDVIDVLLHDLVPGIGEILEVRQNVHVGVRVQDRTHEILAPPRNLRPSLRLRVLIAWVVPLP